MDEGHHAVSKNPAPATPLRQRWLRAIDGGRAWGSIDVWPSKYGFRKSRLVVYPPGIGAVERRYVRLARSWPTWGAALWLTLAVGFSSHGGGWPAVVYPTAAFMVSGAIIFALARDAHAYTRTMSAAVIAGHEDPEAAARYARVARLTHTLVTADAMLSRNELTIVEHEAIWWTVYEVLGQIGNEHV